MTLRRYDALKRILDVVVGGSAFVLSLPLQAAVAVVVAARLGRPVIFRQARPGRDGQLFELRKFRSMRPLDPKRGLESDAERLTPFGRALRSTSLDELPSLWNIVRGDMSIVGPRPLLPQYLPLYTPQQARRHEVRPGLTGYAQVAGRNSVDWEERLRLDVEYVDQRSFALDVSIIWRTLTTVLSRSGISAEGHATMAPFEGTTAMSRGDIAPDEEGAQ